MDFSRIDAQKQWLDGHRPLPPALVARLHEDIVLRWTFHSNAIEGNTLTLLETKVVLEGVTIGGKNVREHLEAINHRDAILYIEDIVAGNEAFSEWQIRNIHQLVLKNIDNDNAGKYRNVNVTISGATHVPPDHLQVADRMAAFAAWYQQSAAALHPVERAARVHADFVGIHPFIDGNGRTSRLLMNLELMKAGYPPAVLPVARRFDYYKALETAHMEGNYAPFIALIAEFAEEAFAPYRHALGDTP